MPTDSVYQPAEDSYMMQDALVELLKTADPKPQTVLDMGTGSGILAIVAAKLGCSVTAVDINPEALTAAKANAAIAGVKIKPVRSDLFERVTGKFDLITFNPPYVRTEDSELKTADMQSRAWAGGKDGMQVINRFLSSVCGFLKPEGRILLLVSTLDDKEPKLKGFKTKVRKRASLFFEKLWVLELIPDK
jgi:release factor glutamine methyltransferase